MLAAGGDGAVVNRGTLNSGFALYIRDGRLHFDYNAFHDHTFVAAETALVPGRHGVSLAVVRGPERRGDVRLGVDGAVAATGVIPRLVGVLSSTGMDLGRTIAPVNGDYRPPFDDPGRIVSVGFELPQRSSGRDERERPSAKAARPWRASSRRRAQRSARDQSGRAPAAPETLPVFA